MSTVEWGLKEIKQRYYHEISYVSHGQKANAAGLRHCADCAIFRSIDHYGFCFCSCGLLYDLDLFLANSNLIEVVYPRYYHDYYLQENGEDSDGDSPEVKSAKEQERKECQRILVEVFGPANYTTIQEIKQQYEDDKKLLLTVFGNNFETAFSALDLRFKTDIEKYRLHETYRLSASKSS